MSLDKTLMQKHPHFRWTKCSKGHLNSPNAEVCWRCGEKLVKEADVNKGRTLPIGLYTKAKEVLSNLCNWCGKRGSNDCDECQITGAEAVVDTYAPKGGETK